MTGTTILEVTSPGGEVAVGTEGALSKLGIGNGGDGVDGDPGDGGS